MLASFSVQHIDSSHEPCAAIGAVMRSRFTNLRNTSQLTAKLHHAITSPLHKPIDLSTNLAQSGSPILGREASVPGMHNVFHMNIDPVANKKRCKFEDGQVSEIEFETNRGVTSAGVTIPCKTVSWDRRICSSEASGSIRCSSKCAARRAKFCRS